MDGSPGFTQQSRLLNLHTPLGDDMLLPIRFEGLEAVNTPFEFRVTARAKRDDVKADELVGRLIDVGIERSGEGDYRSWNALCVGLVEDAPSSRGLRLYKLVLKPQTWLLTQKSDCRIWMDQTTLDVAQTLLSEHGLPAPDISGVTRSPEPQHYSVQWNETDYDYLMRRLDEDGLFHWYVHEQGKHVLTLGDHASAWREADQPDVRFSRGSTERDHIVEWSRTLSFVPGKRAGRDWNFETPTMTPEGETPSMVDLTTNKPYELYEYPARAITPAAGEQASKLRMQAAETDFEGAEGRSSVRTLAPGFKFTPYDIAKPENHFDEQVIAAIEHVAQDESYETSTGEPGYQNAFRTAPAKTPLTPHRRTRRPRIDGAQIAIVAGPDGEEIHTEQYGRIKLWFPWDRRAKKDGTDTCWVRVSQSWGGGQWGQQIIPRVGMEVAVSYLDGDPDRPMVVGVVPNPVNSVPYDLPANKTRMVFRSNSYKSSYRGFNEIALEDDSGREELFMQAQKDMHVGVKNNFVQYTNAFHHQQIGMSETRVVLGWADYYYNQNLTVSTGRNLFQMIGQPDAVMSVMSATFVDRANFNLPFGMIATQTDLDQNHTQGSYVTVAAGDIAMTAGANYTTHVSGNGHYTYDKGVATISGKDHSLSATANVVISAGKNMVLAANETIVLNVGKSSITMRADGEISMSGVKVEVNGEEYIAQKAKTIHHN